MSTDAHWARIVAAASNPPTPDSPDLRQQLLADALALGTTLTEHGLDCSVTQLTDTGYRTPAASGERALALDVHQYEDSRGPCVHACQDGGRHEIQDMHDAVDVYPAFATAALAAGVRSSLSLPLPGATPAALNLYARTPDAFTVPRTRATAELLARCVARFLPSSAPEVDRVAEAVRTDVGERRGLVERARTVVAGEAGLDPSRAFQRLTVLSRTRQCSIFDVAADVVRRGTAGPDLA